MSILECCEYQGALRIPRGYSPYSGIDSDIFQPPPISTLFSPGFFFLLLFFFLLFRFHFSTYLI